MAKRSDLQLAGLLGLGEQSARKSHYPELLRQLYEVEQEKNRYKWLFEHANYGIFQARINGGMRAVNPALLQMLGYERAEDLVSRDSAKAEYMFAGGRQELDEIHRRLQRDGALRGYETRLRGKQDRYCDVLLNLFMHPGEVDQLEGFVADITERKKAQRRLYELNQELEQRVELRTRELHRSNQELQEQVSLRQQVEQSLREARDAAEAANRSKDKYLAAASHDLLQPLNAARLLISTLQERELPAAEKHLVNRAHLALEGAEELLGDLLDIARLDQAAVKPVLAACPVADLMEALVSEFEPVAKAEGLALSHVPCKLWVHTDCHLLLRILRNFLSNACRYTGQGRIVLGARRRGSHLSLQVWDTGPGLTPEQQALMFAEFTQFDSPQQGLRKGVGLGLAIVERIARMLGVRLEVRSVSGAGSCFSVLVPLGEARIQPVVPVMDVPDILQGSRILVIDNEPDILLSMQALLEQWHCRVIVASDFAGAVAELGSQPPDLILADLHLDHGVNGLQVIEQLRQYFVSELPAVLITADRADEQAALRQRLQVPVLNKPVRPSKLRAILSQRLSQQAAASD